MAEKDFVLGNENLDSDMILGVITSCCKKGVVPTSVNSSEMLVTKPELFKSMQSLAKGKVLLNAGGKMVTLVLGGEATSLPADAVKEFYTNLQTRVEKLPDAENAPSELEFIDLAIKQGDAFRDKSNEGILHALKNKVLSTVLTAGTPNHESAEVELDLDPVLSAN